MVGSGRFTAQELVDLLEEAGLRAYLVNDRGAVVTGLAYYVDGGAGMLWYYIGLDPAPVAHLREGMLLCRPGLEGCHPTVTLIMTDDPQLAFYRLSRCFAPPAPAAGVHGTAVVSPAARVHPSATVGPYCVLEECEVGPGAHLVSHVSVYAGSRIGAGTRVESGACIGVTGVVWAWGPDGEQWEMAQLGGVAVGDHCFIGSNVSIVRGSLRDTVLGDHCHVAHGSMIGHDCRFGSHVHLANNVAVGGTVVLGDGCFVGSGVSLRPKVTLARDTIVGTGAVVVDDFSEPGRILVGVPAAPMKQVKERPAAIPRPRARPGAEHGET